MAPKDKFPALPLFLAPLLLQKSLCYLFYITISIHIFLSCSAFSIIIILTATQYTPLSSQDEHFAVERLDRAFLYYQTPILFMYVADLVGLDRKIHYLTPIYLMNHQKLQQYCSLMENIYVRTLVRI